MNAKEFDEKGLMPYPFDMPKSNKAMMHDNMEAYAKHILKTYCNSMFFVKSTDRDIDKIFEYVKQI